VTAGEPTVAEPAPAEVAVAEAGNESLAWLAFVPRDTVFIRDGRAFDAAADTSGETVRPWPSTIAGAVGAAFGAGPAATAQDVPEEVRGPVLARRTGRSWLPYFPLPADLAGEAGAEAGTAYAFRLRTGPAPAGTGPGEARIRTDLDGAVPGGGGLRWLVPPPAAGTVEPLSGWMPGARLEDYLSGELAAGEDGIPVADLELEEPLKREIRVGLARADRQARTGFLYQAAHLRPEDGWGFLAGCTLRAGWKRRASGPVRFGGRGRLADVEKAGDVSWPGRPGAFPGGRVLVYLATPALWRDGWRIPVPDGAVLAAAATGEPEPVASTTPDGDWARNRVLRWAVPAGSVYLLEFGDPGRALEWAAGVHGRAYGRDDDDRLRTAGFGIVLTGVWT